MSVCSLHSRRRQEGEQGLYTDGNVFAAAVCSPADFNHSAGDQEQYPAYRKQPATDQFHQLNFRKKAVTEGERWTSEKIV